MINLSNIMAYFILNIPYSKDIFVALFCKIVYNLYNNGHAFMCGCHDMATYVSGVF